MSEVFQNCPACQTKLRPNATFCHLCGYALKPDEQILNQQNAPSVETQNLHLGVLKTSGDIILKDGKNLSNQPVSPRNAILQSQTDFSNEQVVHSSNGINKSDSNIKQQFESNNQTQKMSGQSDYIWTESNPSAWRIVVISVLILIFAITLLWVTHIGR